MILLTICLRCWNTAFLCFSVWKFHIAVQKLVWLPPSQVEEQTRRSKDMYPQLYSSVVGLGLETCLTFMHWYKMKANSTKYYGEEVNSNGDIKLPVPSMCNIFSFDSVVQLAKSRVPESSILFFFFFNLCALTLHSKRDIFVIIVTVVLITTTTIVTKIRMLSLLVGQVARHSWESGIWFDKILFLLLSGKETINSHTCI